MQRSTKKAIDLVVPSLVSIGTAFYFITRKQDRDVKFIILVLVLVFALSYGTVTQVTKAIVAAGEKPEDVNVPADTGTKINSTTGERTGFDVDGWIERVKKDVYAPFWGVSVRDADLYSKMKLLSNNELVSMWNAWNKKYFSEEAETMTEAIDAEMLVPFSSVYNDVDTILTRLKKLGCK